MSRRRATHPVSPARGQLPARLALGVAMTSVLLGLSNASLAAAAGPASAANTSAEGGFADFDPSMLSGGSHNAIDLRRFERGAVVLPGIYNLDVYLNRDWVGRLNVHFIAPKPGASALPCITPELMDRMGLKPAEGAPAFGPDHACMQIEQLVPGAHAHFDQPDLRLDISVPQAYMHQLPRGYVNPSSWDAGVPAALLNYNFNAYRTDSNGISQTSTYLGLNAGLNIGPWHLRQKSTATWQSSSNGAPSRQRWNNIAAYAQRDLPSLRSTLTVGDSYTDGTIFDSLGLRGVQLGTDDRMLPQSLRGYAPVVHGVAETNAKVTVTQNGVQIYQTSVSPGPFTINDLYPTGYGGDLRVTVTEANGRTHSFSVPYASVSQLLRAGTTRFDVAFGRLRNLAIDHEPNLIQATVQHGFSNLFTGYAGLQGSQGYAAALVGGAFNTRYGAFAMDLTQAGTTLPGHRAMDGQSIRLSYSKLIPTSRTALTVAAYRYSSSGYLSLSDAVRARDYARRGLSLTQYLPSEQTTVDGVSIINGLTPAQQAALSGNASTSSITPVATGLIHRRNHFTLSLNQQLGGDAGSLYANASISDYWQRSGHDTQFQVGYNNRFREISYNVSATRTRGPLGRYDDQFFVGVSIPLGESARAPSFTLNLNHDDANGSQQQAMVNGTLGSANQFTYGVTASHVDNGAGSAGSVNGTYRGRYAVLGASYGKGSSYSQASFNASGAVVAHSGGITFGQPTGDTIGIVHAPGAAGARVTNAPGVRVDDSGYALVPYMNPYQLNTVRLDPQGLSLGVQLGSTSEQVAPYAGAVVMLDFKTRQGRALIAHLHLADGKPVPFGAEVVDAEGHNQGVVGQGGLALLRVKDKNGRLSAKWKGPQESSHRCQFEYALPADASRPNAQSVIDVTCNAHPATPSSEGKS
ncbi:fimbrial biogenesis outer membrane usher protein [Oleiagrimonas citrea]|uniref:Fimbrial biogenesis outer membrane usher protein n=1 Tax=Oleiagrimonas citrea TaxID=1665687 RepID=A0A846ZKS7_9GAMM|nr:fimbria/pilus outer membrane usher protein [Oleiagrimonas citrea]NKZ38616.1 fimbrial biogenesis outer membrane usher protein [Oleiagrimonas citrea]